MSTPLRPLATTRRDDGTHTTPPRIVIAVLAAGAGTRFAGTTDGADKLCAEVHGRPLLAWTLAIADHGLRTHDDAIRTVIVDESHPARAAIAHSHGWNTVNAPHAQRGIRWSVDAAARHAAAIRAGLVVLLGDDPLAACELPAVWAHALRRPYQPAAVLRPGGPPHPVFIPHDMLAELMLDPDTPATHPDHGLLQLLRATPYTQWIEPADARLTPRDVDIPRDLSELASILATLAASLLR